MAIFRGAGFWPILLLKRLSKMNKVKAHTLRKYEEAKLVEELTQHRVSHLSIAQSRQHIRQGPFFSM
jgi:hypothetical protein